MVVKVAGYAYLVPFVEDDDHFFLKTIIPSRKLRAISSRRSPTMSTLDPYELEVLEAYESGRLKPIASKAQLQRMRAAARATAIKDKRVNIRLSSVDLLDIQARALEEGMPYQTLIASVLRKFVTGKLAEQASALPDDSSRPGRRSSGRRTTPLD
jgi:predicted DNA binding CopG/RHH family protein